MGRGKSLKINFQREEEDLNVGIALTQQQQEHWMAFNNDCNIKIVIKA